jgi:hypothetical protein
MLNMIMQFLGIPPFSAVSVTSPIPQLTLAMLEEAIANVTALTFWSSENKFISNLMFISNDTFLAARYNNYTGPVDLLSRSPTSPFLPPSKVDANQVTLLYRVNVCLH